MSDVYIVCLYTGVQKGLVSNVYIVCTAIFGVLCSLFPMQLVQLLNDGQMIIILK